MPHCRDVDAAQQATLQHCGKVLSKTHYYSQRGRQAVLADPDGAVFAVLAAEGGDPPDYLAAPGEWIWSSVLVRDPKQEIAFYKSLFGYDVYDLAGAGGSVGDAQHYILSSANYSRAGLNVLPGDSMRRYPHWLKFVRVTDASGHGQEGPRAGWSRAGRTAHRSPRVAPGSTGRSERSAILASWNGPTPTPSREPK